MSAVISNRTAVFQGMRVIALLCVMFLHSGYPIVDIGCPITFFFVISGFLYKEKGDSYKSYMLKKCLKIFPVYWLTFFIDFFINSRAFSWKMIPHLLLLQTYIPSIESGDVKPFYYEYVGVSWFVSCLLFCYMLSPFIHRMIVNLNNSVIMLIMIGILTIMSIYYSIEMPLEYAKWYFYVSPYFRFLQYVLGMLMARILSSPPPM